MRIHVLVLNGVFDTGLATVLDTFALGNALASSAGVPGVPFEVSRVAIRRRVTTGQGLLVPVQLPARLKRADALLVPRSERSLHLS